MNLQARYDLEVEKDKLTVSAAPAAGSSSPGLADEFPAPEPSNLVNQINRRRREWESATLCLA